jgi:hypothetical protein
MPTSRPTNPPKRLVGTLAPHRRRVAAGLPRTVSRTAAVVWLRACPAPYPRTAVVWLRACPAPYPAPPSCSCGLAPHRIPPPSQATSSRSGVNTTSIRLMAKITQVSWWASCLEEFAHQDTCWKSDPFTVEIYNRTERFLQEATGKDT